MKFCHVNPTGKKTLDLTARLLNLRLSDKELSNEDQDGNKSDDENFVKVKEEEEDKGEEDEEKTEKDEEAKPEGRNGETDVVSASKAEEAATPEKKLKDDAEEEGKVKKTTYISRGPSRQYGVSGKQRFQPFSPMSNRSHHDDFCYWSSPLSDNYESAGFEYSVVDKSPMYAMSPGPMPNLSPGPMSRSPLTSPDPLVLFAGNTGPFPEDINFQLTELESPFDGDAFGSSSGDECLRGEQLSPSYLDELEAYVQDESGFLGDVRSNETDLLSISKDDLYNINHADLSPQYLETVMEAIEKVDKGRTDIRALPEELHGIILELKNIDRTELDEYVGPASTPFDLEQELELDVLCDKENQADIINRGATSTDESLENPAKKTRKPARGRELSRSFKVLQKRCQKELFKKANRKLGGQTDARLCGKDADGDTCMMIIMSRAVDSPGFYENMLALYERLKSIRLCCDAPVDESLHRCVVCQNQQENTFYTPLSQKNNKGETVLSCALKMEHPREVVNFILGAIRNSEADRSRIFDREGQTFFKRFLDSNPELRLFF